MAINILVVDDSSVMRNMIRRTIKMCGVDIAHYYEAGNGKEGLSMLENNHVDLLFIDVNMPVMDGMEMLEKVRKEDKTKNLPVLIVSTESSEGRIQNIDRRSVDFVYKPFTPEILRERIQHILNLDGD